jgi:hypothetical protein
MTFNAGVSILTPSQRTGTVQPSPWAMPFHTLIQFDDTGQRYWILTEILRSLPADWTPPKKVSSRRQTAAMKMQQFKPP